MDTPNISHITLDDYEHVYEPAEDSFLLLDALEKDMKNIIKQAPRFCLEIGTGSGVVITALAQLLKGSSHCFAVDISPYACKVAQSTVAKNNVNTVDVINMNLLSNFKNNSIDLLLFNPPYVPSRLEKTETSLESHPTVVASSSIVSTWAGGVDGREVIDLVLKDLNRILAPGGVFYLLLLKENRPEEVCCNMVKQGYIAEVLMERRIIGEHLYILKIINNTCIKLDKL